MKISKEFESEIYETTINNKKSDLPIDFDQVYEFTGFITYERFYSDDSSWGVYTFNSEIELPTSITIRNNNLFSTKEDDRILYQVTLRGKMQRLDYSDIPYKVKAKLSNHTKWGYGFEVISISQDTPKTISDTKLFLKSILTENQVETLLEVYPDIVDMVIDNKNIDSEIDLNKLKGIKDFTWTIIKNKILDNYLMSDVLSLLSPYGISQKRIKQLFNEEPNPYLLKEKLLNDPYIITEIDGIGFKTADTIALKINSDLLISEQRVKGFIKDYLKNIGEDRGDTWIYLSELDSAIKENILEAESLYNEFIESEKQHETILHIEEDEEKNDYMVGFHYYYWVESEIWDIINELNNQNNLYLTQENIDEGIRIAEEIQGYKYTKEQLDVILNVLKKSFSVIVGLGGTGKTSITRAILNIYDQAGYSIGACALSARAGKRLEEVSGFQAMTIHRLLGAQGLNQFLYNRYNKLPYNIIIVDEYSMIYSGLYLKLFEAINPGTKVILIGDVGQLPPLSYGSFPTDILSKENFQINKLTKVHRQAERSGIISDANKIRNGKDPLKGEKLLKTIHGELQDMYYICRNDRESLRKIAINTFLKSVEEVGLDNVQIIVPRKKDCINSTEEINKIIQGILTSNTSSEIKHGKKSFKLNNKVMHIKNNYDLGVFNGEIGYIKEIGIKENQDYLIVEYPDKMIEYTRSELSELDLAWASTCHKIQGGQAKYIIGIIDNTHYTLLDQTFLYTMLTRGQERVLLLYEPYAYDRCLNNNKVKERNTWMKRF